MILSTPNRTPLSRLAMITLGEGLGLVPKGTHDWQKFLTPDELAGHVVAAGLQVVECKGLSFSPAVGFHLSDNLALDYFLTAAR
jgi:2-polyprenyl-6-hydroxyphenyl methylase/3-demethylubiquinone-9 3-methyltransferase